MILTIRASSLYPKIGSFLLSSQSSSSSPSDTQALISSASTSATESNIYRKLLASYLLVYLLATLSDWLQGPYVYALYDAYGFSPREIAILFVAGFGSSKWRDVVDTSVPS